MFRASQVFLEAAQEQGVRLDALDRAYLTAPTAPVDPPLHALIQAHHDNYALAGKLHNRLQSPLDVAALPDGGPYRMLGALLNTTFGIPDTSPSAYTCLTPSRNEFSICDGIEESWFNTLLSQEEIPAKPPLVQVFTNSDGLPVAMRKGRGAHATGVLLEPVRGNAAATHDAADVQELVYGPGAIVQISTKHDAALLERKLVPRPVQNSDKVEYELCHKLVLPDGHSLVSPASDITGLHFSRLSPLMYDDPDILAEQHYGAPYLDKPMSRLRDLAHAVVAHAQKG
ncbi:MAG TPA: hypothetical protein VD735_03085 [Candidatus Saccharimonadales bacterium]|nr:hypothetical protein [Candidatus Saccharimonadales bacterium]